MILYWIFFIGVSFSQLQAQSYLKPHTNALASLIEHSLWTSESSLKLHLGCGISHLNGYINIDFPPSEHTVQNHSGADIFGDITNIVFPFQSVDEIRSHHVFEHFMRGTALGMLSAWHLWLKQDGILIIETPDFENNIKQLLNPELSYIDKQVVLRHLAGSHEASWAIHCDGWYKEKFEHTLSILGFTIQKIDIIRYKNLYNIAVTAVKKINYKPEDLLQRSMLLLSESMVDNTMPEQLMLQTWTKSYFETLKNMILLS